MAILGRLNGPIRVASERRWEYKKGRAYFLVSKVSGRGAGIVERMWLFTRAEDSRMDLGGWIAVA